ncbi:signal protein [Janthinobacterium sp. BJB412]|nr:signal protein [Janthinobacterium sp. BJB412]
MKLLYKFNLVLLLIFALGWFATAQLTRRVLQDNAKREVVSHASLMMEAAMAARDYTSNEVKPLLAKALQTQFLPQSVPSYAATQSFNKLHQAHPDYSYKEAALNPTNPRDRVVDWEADVVQQFRDHAELKELTGERQTPAGPSLYLARPIRISDGRCLACHSTPAAAPETMKALYGSNNGFGWKLGETIGSQIVSVPLAVPQREAEQAYALIMGGMGATFGVILLAVNALFYLLVLRPMNRISRIADAVSAGRLDAEHFDIRGKDEIAVLSNAFNRMRRSLEKAMALLA